MPDTQQLADSMLVAAGEVFGRLVEEVVSASAGQRNDHDGSIRTDGDELVTLVEIPSVGARVVVRFPRVDMQQVVALMLGGGDGASEMGPMQLSIASETVSQVAVAMAEQLAKDLAIASHGIHAELCNDATLLPPPPFESYDGGVRIGNIQVTASIDFAAITRSNLGIGHVSNETLAHAPAPAASEPQRPAPLVETDVRNVAFTPMNPTPSRVQSGPANLDLVHDVPLQIRAVLGKTVMPLREVVSMQSGTVFELDKLSAEPIDLYVNNVLIARGEVVVVDDKYAVKISELNPTVA